MENSTRLKKSKVKYKISILNENTLEEIVHFRLSTMTFSIALFFGLVIVLILYSTLILTTPLKSLLPENIDNSLRKEVINNAMQIDSLIKEVEIREEYINTFRSVVTGEIALDSTNMSSDSLIVKKRDEALLEKSAKEKEFCQNFEQKEQYNLSSTTTEVSNIVFFKPVAGVITKDFNKEDLHNGIDVLAEKSAPILSVYNGVVLYAGYNMQDGYVIQIIHPQGFISVYRGSETLLKKEGDIVKTGEVIALLPDEQSTKPSVLHFELWNSMQVQNPRNYIVFE